MISPELKDLIHLLSKLPGLGPRSGRRAALHLLRHRTSTLPSLVKSLQEVSEKIQECQVCGNLDSRNPCTLCEDANREPGILCVVETVGDLWALEKAGSFKGRYHILGGTLSALDGIGVEDLSISALLKRCREEHIGEVIMALNATVEGQATSHYIIQQLRHIPVAQISTLARGIPVGGELDYLDEGTLSTAFLSRRIL